MATQPNRPRPKFAHSREDTDLSLADPGAAPLTREAVPGHADPNDDTARWDNRLLRDVGDEARRPVHPTRSRVVAWTVAIMIAATAIAALVIFESATMNL